MGDLAALGALLLGQQRYTEAETVLERSLAIWQGRYGHHHYEVAVVKHNLAALHYARGDAARGLRTLIEALDIKLHILGPTHTEVVRGPATSASRSCSSSSPRRSSSA